MNCLIRQHLTKPATAPARRAIVDVRPGNVPRGQRIVWLCFVGAGWPRLRCLGCVGFAVGCPAGAGRAMASGNWTGPGGPPRTMHVVLTAAPPAWLLVVGVLFACSQWLSLEKNSPYYSFLSPRRPSIENGGFPKCFDLQRYVSRRARPGPFAPCPPLHRRFSCHHNTAARQQQHPLGICVRICAFCLIGHCRKSALFSRCGGPARAVLLLAAVLSRKQCAPHENPHSACRAYRQHASAATPAHRAANQQRRWGAEISTFGHRPLARGN